MLKKADIVLFDTAERGLLFPFTQIRPVADIRFGIFTCKERWQYISGKSVEILTTPYLQHDKFVSPGDKLFINAALLPDGRLLQFINALKNNEAIVYKDKVIAFFAPHNVFNDIKDITVNQFDATINYESDIAYITYPWHLFQYNEQAIRFDFALLTNGRSSASLSATNQVSSRENIFVEEGAIVEHSIINASAGPVYIGSSAIVMEGSMIRGPFVLGEGAVIKMGTIIYGSTTIGPYSQAGGEIKNSIIMGYSNKGHYGYLGDAVIGEWCNLGAGTSNSNVRNDAGELSKTIDNKMLNIGLKCGVMLGDYSRTAINTSLNTATFAGIACNIFGNGLTPRYVPDFTWGFNERYVFEKALKHIDNWKKLKNSVLTNNEIEILNYLYKTKL